MNRFAHAVATALLAIPVASSDSACAAGAVKMFVVDPLPMRLLGDEPAWSEARIDAYFRHQMAMIEASYVLNAALHHLQDAEIGPLRQAGDSAVEWLKDAIAVRRRDQTRLLEVVVSHQDLRLHEAQTIAEAVGKAYMKEVVFRERSRRLKPRDILMISERKLAQEIRRKTEANTALTKELGRLDDVAAALKRDHIGRLGDEVLRLEDQLFQRKIKQITADRDNREEVTRVEAEVERAYAEKIEELRGRIESLSEQLRTGSEANSELEMRRDEIEQLKGVQREVRRRIERWDIELEAPANVTPLPGVDSLRDAPDEPENRDASFGDLFGLSDH